MSDMEGVYPLLCQIDAPSDLRQLPLSQLKPVCQELRDYMLDVLSKHPGHLGSSLGAVEIATALHYVFKTPYDRIVWDVGHQAYAHKILTGRRDAFTTLRQKDGIAGFPKPSESPYDTFPAGHASNSISAALGMAVAAKSKEEVRQVVAVIGDGSMTGGLAFEGLNNSSSFPNNLLVIFNDNNMSIDPNVGGLNKFMVDINTSNAYNSVRYDLYRGLKRLHIVNESNKRNIIKVNNSIKSLLSNDRASFFAGLGIRYFGPIDGNDVERLVNVLRRIMLMDGPKILHVRTTKGKGYKPAEQEATVWHAPGKFDVQTGERVHPTPDQPKPLKFQEVFGHTITELAKSDDRIVGITPAMPSGCSLNIMARELPERVYDVGIAEGHAVTFSAGLASQGMIPFCNIYSSFAQRAYDQIIHDVALANYHVVICLDRAGLVGEDGSTHQGAYDLAYLNPIPNLTISAPMDEHYLRHLMYTAYKEVNGPMVIRYPRGEGSQVDWQVPFETLPVGRGRQVSQGTDVAFVSIGTIGVEVQKAIAMLSQEPYSLSAAHYDMIFLKPIDRDLCQEICSQYDKIIVVEDGSEIGGLGTQFLFEANRLRYKGDIELMGLPDQFIEHGTVSQQKAYCRIDAQSLTECALRLVSGKPHTIQ